MKTLNPLDRAKNAFQKAVTRANIQAREHATVGWRKAHDNVLIAVPGRKNMVYMTKLDQTVTVALNRAGVPLNAFLPVLFVMENNTAVIVARDNSNAGVLTQVPDSGYGVPAHPHALSGLADVLLTSLADGQILAWDATASKWVNVTEAGALVASVNGQTGVVVLDADDIDDTATTNKFSTAAELSKLAGIETGADVTDATNVAAAGAVMDSELIATSAGAGDAGKPIKLDAAGHVDATMINDADINLDNVTEGATNRFYTSTEKTKLAGIATGANLYVHPNHSGDVTSVADGATTIANDAVTNAKAANMAQATIKGRASGAGTGDPTDLTPAQVATIIDTALSSLYMLLTTNQTATGVKTFSTRVDAPIVRANSAAGLRLEDDAGNLSVFVADGGQAVTVGGGTLGAQLNFDGGAGQARQIQYRSGGSNRWILEVTADAESGSDAGSNFKLRSRTDAGGVKSDVITVERSTGNVSLSAALSVSGAVAAASAQVTPGTSSNDAKVGGVLYVTTTQTGNVGTGEDTLASYSVPANTLAVNGQSLWFEAWGSFAANGNNKTVKARFGSSGTNLMFDTGAVAVNGQDWFLRGRIIRTGAATQKSGVQFTRAVVNVDSVTALDQTLSGAVTLAISGEATSNNDIVIESFVVGYDDANS